MTVGDHVSDSIAFDTYNRFRSYVTVEQNVCAYFERSFLQLRGWQAVVVNEEITPDEAQMLAAACRLFGYTTATALDVDHFDSGFIRKIGLDAESLARLEKTFFGPSYLVVEAQENFMLVSDSDYYWCVVGLPRFLQRCFTKSLDVVNQEFVDATRRNKSPIHQSLKRIAAETLGKPAPSA